MHRPWSRLRSPCRQHLSPHVCCLHVPSTREGWPQPTAVSRPRPLASLEALRAPFPEADWGQASGRESGLALWPDQHEPQDASGRWPGSPRGVLEPRDLVIGGIWRAEEKPRPMWPPRWSSRCCLRTPSWPPLCTGTGVFADSTLPCAQDEAHTHHCQLLVLRPGHGGALREPQLLGLPPLRAVQRLPGGAAPVLVQPSCPSPQPGDPGDLPEALHRGWQLGGQPRIFLARSHSLLSAWPGSAENQNLGFADHTVPVPRTQLCQATITIGALVHRHSPPPRLQAPAPRMGPSCAPWGCTQQLAYGGSW